MQRVSPGAEAAARFGSAVRDAPFEARDRRRLGGGDLLIWIAPLVAAGVLAAGLTAAMREEACWRRLATGQAWLQGGICRWTPPEDLALSPPVAFRASGAAGDAVDAAVAAPVSASAGVPPTPSEREDLTESLLPPPISPEEQ